MANSGKRKGSKRPRERSYVDPSDPSTAQAPGHRIDRLEHVLRDELSSILRDEVTNPRLYDIRIRSVELSVDYRNARVWFTAPESGAVHDIPSTLGGSNPAAAQTRAIEAALEITTPFLRARLGEMLDLKRVPNLRFLPFRGELDELEAAQATDEFASVTVFHGVGDEDGDDR